MLEPISWTVIAGGVLLSSLFGGVHRVPEGHVAVYFRGGRLLDRLSGPGYHVKTPLLEQVQFVQVTMQTDKVPHGVEARTCVLCAALLCCVVLCPSLLIGPRFEPVWSSSCATCLIWCGVPA